MKTKEQLKEEIKQEAIDYDDKANILKIDELSEDFIEGAGKFHESKLNLNKTQDSLLFIEFWKFLKKGDTLKKKS